MARMIRGLPAFVPALAAILLASAPAGAAIEQTGRDQLRVCADPNSLPYSNEKGEGFENKLAEMIAADLGVEVTYTWWPQTIGFVRNTLGSRKCDIVMGTASGEALMQNTNPYYRSTYALVYREGGGISARTLKDPSLKGARIGIVAQTPAIDFLFMNDLTNIEPYQLAVDTRSLQPARQAVEDVAAGLTDAAVLWGPLAAYWAKQQQVPLTVVPLTEEPGGQRMTFHISMGIRPEEPEWKHWLNDWIKANQPRIDALLNEYGVPLLDRNGKLIQAAAPEPTDYRKADYLAPVPATLAGAQVLTTPDVVRLLAGPNDPLLIDVLPPKAPQPEGREGAWLPRPHESLPGAIWLPDTGWGEPTAEQAEYFQRGLEQVTGGDHTAPLVFFCRRDCWMSWNAAKRALELGYTNVAWYPDGTDGWTDARRALAPATPWDGGPAKG